MPATSADSIYSYLTGKHEGAVTFKEMRVIADAVAFGLGLPEVEPEPVPAAPAPAVKGK